MPARTLRLSVEEEAQGARLDAYLAAHDDALTRSAWKRAIEEGRVTVGGRVAAKPGLALKAGMAIEAEIPDLDAGALEGEAIPIEARVVTVADVFDALLSPRPYKEAWSIERALEYLVSQSGKMLDPACVRALMANLPGLYGICDRYSHVAVRQDWR